MASTCHVANCHGACGAVHAVQGLGNMLWSYAKITSAPSAVLVGIVTRMVDVLENCRSPSVLDAQVSLSLLSCKPAEPVSHAYPCMQTLPLSCGQRNPCNAWATKQPLAWCQEGACMVCVCVCVRVSQRRRCQTRYGPSLTSAHRNTRLTLYLSGKTPSHPSCCSQQTTVSTYSQASGHNRPRAWPQHSRRDTSHTRYVN